jgi:hypothetical protein
MKDTVGKSTKYYSDITLTVSRLKISLVTLGIMPYSVSLKAQCTPGPRMVYVFPEPDWPYATTDISYPVTNELSPEI